MTVTLRQPLTLAECQLVREWRNDPAVLPMLRTGHKTAEQQEQFYHDVICNPESQHWYYAIEADGQFVGMGGLTYLDSDNRMAEISLIVSPEVRGKGVGSKAVDALMVEAKRIGLVSVVGECYATGAIEFWTKQIARRQQTFLWRWML